MLLIGTKKYPKSKLSGCSYKQHPHLDSPYHIIVCIFYFEPFTIIPGAVAQGYTWGLHQYRKRIPVT